MDCEQPDYTQVNRVMWNETAAIHQNGYVQQLISHIHDPNFSTFDKIEEQFFAEIDLCNKAVAQLACNNGRELISVKKAGAACCVGFDISEGFIQQANELATAANVDVEFCCIDICQIPEMYHNQFDLVYITIGVLGWMPDLDALFAVISQLLKPGGQLFIYEMHPILDMFEAESGSEIVHSYFRTTPFLDENDPDYFDPSQIVHAPSYWFHHKLSDIIGAILNHGLQLIQFDEYDHDLSNVYAAFEELKHKPPLSYSLIARKQN